MGSKHQIKLRVISWDLFGDLGGIDHQPEVFLGMPENGDVMES